MDKIIVEGGTSLSGCVEIDGMKNAAVAVLFASIVTCGVSEIHNVPCIRDVADSIEILRSVGAKVTRTSRTSLVIDTTKVTDREASPVLVHRLRASYYLAGAMLARFGHARVGLPGGCDFGSRPIDLHEKAFARLGAITRTDGDYFTVEAPNGLKGNSIYLDRSSVGATVNAIIAATAAKGETVIENAAREPHIVDLADYLCACGADIRGAGTPVIRIIGKDTLRAGKPFWGRPVQWAKPVQWSRPIQASWPVRWERPVRSGTPIQWGKPVYGRSTLHGARFSIIPDMIEAGTFMIAAAATKGKLTLHGVIPAHLRTITDKLREMGVTVEEGNDSVTVSCGETPLSAISVKTLPYPGFPTDMNPQMTVLLCLAKGESRLSETVWSERFRYIEELRRMGASITVEDRAAIIRGVDTLQGAAVRAVDLRAGAAMIIAALAAEGRTEIGEIGYIERGYDNIVEKFRKVGAKIYKVSEPCSNGAE